MSNTIASHWDLTNGSPNRKWRYMTDIYNPARHWWQYNQNAFITIERKGYAYPWTYTIWQDGKPAITGGAYNLAQAKRNALGIAQSRKS